MTKRNKTAIDIRNILSEDYFLVGLLILGTGLLLYWTVYEYRETIAVLGAAFIIAGSVGLYMMVSTRKVARGLHKRFDKLNDTLQEMASSQKESAASQHSILKEIAVSQKEIATSQKEIAVSQHSILKEIATSQKEIAVSQKEIATSQHNVEDILKKIEEKITVTSPS